MPEENLVVAWTPQSPGFDVHGFVHECSIEDALTDMSVYAEGRTIFFRKIDLHRYAPEMFARVIADFLSELGAEGTLRSYHEIVL